MVNKVILVGNVGNDPEVTYVQENVPVAKFSLATTERYKDKNGEKVENTEWHNIVIWRGLAKVVEQYVKKGSKLYLEGKLTHRKYEKDGQTKYFTEIVVREMQMLDSKGGGNGNRETERTSQTTEKQGVTNNTQPEKPVETKTAAFDDGFEVDDLPF